MGKNWSRTVGMRFVSSSLSGLCVNSVIVAGIDSEFSIRSNF
jgi:hypothetical protein